MQQTYQIRVQQIKKARFVFDLSQDDFARASILPTTTICPLAHRVLSSCSGISALSFRAKYAVISGKMIKFVHGIHLSKHIHSRHSIDGCDISKGWMLNDQAF